MTTNESPLKISESERDGVCIISIDGHLDSQTAESAQSIFTNAAEKHSRVLLDCARTTVLGSS
jgi:anti-anti-sigma regulatory factor